MSPNSKSKDKGKAPLTKLLASAISSAKPIKARSDLDYGIKNFTVQFYTIEHNSKSNSWIKLKLYQKISDVFVYVGVNFQVNRSSGRTCDISQNRLYKFCYLLSFELWTFYLVKILFLQGCDNLFWKFYNFTKIFNGLQYNFQV